MPPCRLAPQAQARGRLAVAGCALGHQRHTGRAHRQAGGGEQGAWDAGRHASVSLLGVPARGAGRQAGWGSLVHCLRARGGQTGTYTSRRQRMRMLQAAATAATHPRWDKLRQARRHGHLCGHSSCVCMPMRTHVHKHGRAHTHAHASTHEPNTHIHTQTCTHKRHALTCAHTHTHTLHKHAHAHARTMRRLPIAAAKCSGVLSSKSALSGLMPTVTKRLTWSTFPALTAVNMAGVVMLGSTFSLAAGVASQHCV